MIKKILIGFIIAAVAILLLVWLVTGGPRKIAESARGIGSAFGLFSGATTTGFRLPWQPEGLAIAPDFAEQFSSGEKETFVTDDDLASAEAEYEALLEKIDDAKTFGEPSPHRGSVFLNEGTAAEGGTGSEYIEVETSFSNTAPISLRGWSVQSALTGIRAFIPRGAQRFVLGDVNQQVDIALTPGHRAILSSGVSPVGTSFRTNICSGYLGGLQTFTPSLPRECPPPSDSLPLTPENIQTYGDACYDYVQTLPTCTFPGSIPSNVSAQCGLFLSNNVSYNGCVKKYEYRSDFDGDTWRVYLNASSELWRNTHDIIRLLDAEGRTVDVLTY